MSNSTENDSLALIHRAQEVRAKADRLSDPGAKKTLVDIAMTYEQLAKLAQQQPRSADEKKA
jgi:hypothetical protein